jgi:Kelch motif
MKKLFLLYIFLIVSFICAAQNVGIGVPIPLQKLDINGAIKIGTTTTNQPGTIRYNGGNFEGGNGSSWKSFEALPSKAIILAQSPDTTNLKAAGFSVLRVTDMWDTAFIPLSTNYPGNWTNGFPLLSNATVPASNASLESVMYQNRFIYYGSDAYLYQYDITAQKWDRLGAISPLGIRNSCGITLVGNEIFVTGGWRFVLPNFVLYNSGAKYNLLTNTWSAIANIPVTNAYHGTAAIGTDIYLLNGSSSYTDGVGFNPSKKMYRYNTLTNTWSADLAVANTPDFLFSGQISSRNNKLLWTNGRLLGIEYDPVTHTNTFLSYYPPGGPDFFVNNYVQVVVGNKLYVTGEKRYDNPNTNAGAFKNLHVFYEIELANNLTPPIELNVCKIQANAITTINFNTTTNRFYCLNEANESQIFNRAGNEACDLILVLKGYWSYMKKN